MGVMKTKSPKSLIQNKLFDNYNTISKNFRNKRIKVKEEDFSILEYNEYNLLLEKNYNMNQLKKMCKYYKQKVSGNKREKIFLLFNFLKYSKYASKIQRMVRKHIVQKVLFFKTYPKDNKFYENLKNVVNETDCLTLEHINKINFEELIIIKNGSKKIWTQEEDGTWKKNPGKIYNYAFKISSLYSMMKEGKKNDDGTFYFNHPYTREKILYRPLKTHILKLRKIQRKLGYNVSLEFKDDTEKDILTETKKLELRTISIFQKIDEFGHITNYKWFFELTNTRLTRYIKEMVDIWEYRAQLNVETKRKICPPLGKPFVSLPNNTINITQLFMEREPNYVKKKILDIMEILIKRGIDHHSRSLGVFYVLGALTTVSQDAANALPWLYESFMHV